MAFPTVYPALLSALSANQVPTELSGSGYARAAGVALAYDQVGGIITVPGFSFGPATAAWAAAVYVGLFDAASGGNLLMSWPIDSIVVASGATYTVGVTKIATGVLAPAVAAGAQVGALLNSDADATAGVALAYNAAAQTFGAAALAGVPTVLPYAATVTVNGAVNANFATTLTGNMTMDAENMAAGNRYSIELAQDSVGGHTLTLGAGFKTAGGAPTLSTVASAIDRYSWLNDGTTNWGVLEKAYA